MKTTLEEVIDEVVGEEEMDCGHINKVYQKVVDRYGFRLSAKTITETYNLMQARKKLDEG